MDKQLTLDLFLPLVNESICVESSDGTTCQVRLLEAEPLDGPASEAQPAPFMLVFLAPKGADVQQGMLQLRHESLGELDLFVVPTRQTDDGVCLEAIFN